MSFNCAVLATLLCIALPAAYAEIPEHRQEQIDAALPEKAAVESDRPRRVLIFVTPEHLMPKDPHKGYCIPYGTYALKAMGETTGAYAAAVSDDPAVFFPESIRRFDAIVLNNASRNWITPTDEQMTRDVFKKHGRDKDAVEQVLHDSLLEYVRGGGGLVGIHYAIGANRHWPGFHELFGAMYGGHPWNEEVGIKLDEPDHPVTAFFPSDRFRVADEIYQFIEPYSRDNVRVLLSLDTEATNMDVKWIKRTDGDFALAWVRPFGKGRVFYTALGHRTEIYWNPEVLRLYLRGIQFATGDLEAPAAPRRDSSSKAAHDAAERDENADGQGFVSIFNGKDLTGWSGDPEVWSVKDGAITGQTGNGVRLEHNNFLIWTGAKPANFELRLRYKLTGGNSGIYFHAEKQASGEPLIGPQADMSADHRWTGDVMEWRKRGLLADRGQRVRIDKDGKKHVIGSVGDPEKLLRHVHDDDWNDYHVIVRGNRVILKINGVTMCELIDEDPRRTPAGHLALQTHVGPPMIVQFRDIRIKREE